MVKPGSITRLFPTNSDKGRDPRHGDRSGGNLQIAGNVDLCLAVDQSTGEGLSEEGAAVVVVTLDELGVVAELIGIDQHRETAGEWACRHRHNGVDDQAQAALDS
jgi:hypothetical protein